MPAVRLAWLALQEWTDNGCPVWQYQQYLAICFSASHSPQSNTLSAKNLQLWRQRTHVVLQIYKFITHIWCHIYESFNLVDGRIIQKS